MSQDHRVERSRALREMNELKKQAAKLRGLDSNHMATCRRIENELNRAKDKMAKTQPKATAKSIVISKGGGAPLTSSRKPPASQTAGGGGGGLLAESVQAAQLVRHAALAAENEQLRVSVAELGRQFKGLEATLRAAVAAQAKAGGGPPPAQGSPSHLRTQGEEGQGEQGDAAMVQPGDALGGEGLAVAPSLTHAAAPHLHAAATALHAQVEAHFGVGGGGSVGGEAEEVVAMGIPGSDNEEERRVPPGAGGGASDGGLGSGGDSSAAAAAAAAAAEVAALKAKLARAEAMLVEQDKLVYAALFAGSGDTGSNGKNATAAAAQAPQGRAQQGHTPTAGWLEEEYEEGGGDAEERGWDLEAALSDVQRREALLADKENALREHTEKLDQDRIVFERHQFGSSMSRLAGGGHGGPATPRRTPSRKGAHTPLKNSAGMSPIRLEVPATPATSQVLRDLGISVLVYDEGDTADSPV